MNHPRIRARYLIPIALVFLFACKEKILPRGADDVLCVPDSGDSVILFFCGDVIQHMPQVHGAYNQEEKEYNYLACFKYIIPFWANADFVIANLETTLADSRFSGYPKFCSPWQIARDLNRAGVTTLVTANNHCCDQGARGITNTTRYLDSLGIPHTGIFTDTLDRQKRHPLYLEKNGFKIALLNYTYGTNGLPVPRGFAVSLIDSAAMERDIRQAKHDSATHIIAFMHWGEEYQTHPNRQQKAWSTWLHARGADIVIGSHPHVVQPTEYIISGKDTTGVTAYSLGNFISNQTFPGTDGGIGIRLTVTKKKSVPTRYRMEAIKIYTYRPHEQGRRQYYTIPENMADSVVKGDHLAKSKHSFRKTDSILNMQAGTRH